jgi:hypothetical protein
MMESENKEAAMEDVDTLPPAAAAAAARGEEMAEIQPPLQRQVTFHASNGVLNTT